MSNPPPLKMTLIILGLELLVPFFSELPEEKITDFVGFRQ